ncbi:MAG: hypothetical protein EOO41_02195 [Methanobacteriota archaeon]|nr:MAG: hypothetical protein EOO41_02195 [Euryarchaeota archaeon]
MTTAALCSKRADVLASRGDDVTEVHSRVAAGAEGAQALVSMLYYTGPVVLQRASAAKRARTAELLHAHAAPCSSLQRGQAAGAHIVVSAMVAAAQRAHASWVSQHNSSAAKIRHCAQPYTPGCTLPNILSTRQGVCVL